MEDVAQSGNMSPTRTVTVEGSSLVGSEYEVGGVGKIETVDDDMIVVVGFSSWSVIDVRIKS